MALHTVAGRFRGVLSTCLPQEHSTEPEAPWSRQTRRDPRATPLVTTPVVVGPGGGGLTSYIYPGSRPQLPIVHLYAFQE